MWKVFFWSAARAIGLTRYLAGIQNRLKKTSTYKYSDNPKFVVDENGYNQWSLYRSTQSRLEFLKTEVNQLAYSTRGRRFQALSGLCAIDLLEVPKSPRVLLVGYREDTYDAQGLSKLGFRPQVDYLDQEPAPQSEILEIDSFDSFSILKRDANDLYEDLAPNTYDLIYFSRAGLDLFVWEDALKVLEGARRGASVGVIAHIQSIYWSRNEEWGEIPGDDWLVLDLLADAVMGESLGAKVSNHLLTYAVKAGSKQIRKLVNDSPTNRKLIQAISRVRSDNQQRVFQLTSFPGDPELCSVQLESSPLSAKKSYYMSSVLLWRTSD